MTKSYMSAAYKCTKRNSQTQRRFLWMLACVGAGLLANAVGHSHNVFLTLRIREQARSHILTEFTLGGLGFQPGGVTALAQGLAQPFVRRVLVEAWVPGLR